MNEGVFSIESVSSTRQSPETSKKEHREWSVPRCTMQTTADFGKGIMQKNFSRMKRTYPFEDKSMAVKIGGKVHIMEAKQVKWILSKIMSKSNGKTSMFSSTERDRAYHGGTKALDLSRNATEDLKPTSIGSSTKGSAIVVGPADKDSVKSGVSSEKEVTEEDISPRKQRASIDIPTRRGTTSRDTSSPNDVTTSAIPSDKEIAFCSIRSGEETAYFGEDSHKETSSLGITSVKEEAFTGIPTRDESTTRRSSHDLNTDFNKHAIDSAKDLHQSNFVAANYQKACGKESLIKSSSFGIKSESSKELCYVASAPLNLEESTCSRLLKEKQLQTVTTAKAYGAKAEHRYWRSFDLQAVKKNTKSLFIYHAMRYLRNSKESDEGMPSKSTFM